MTKKLMILLPPITASELNALEPASPGCSLQSWDVGQSPSIALDDGGNVFIGYAATQHLEGWGCNDVKRARFAMVGSTTLFNLYLPLVVRE